MLLQQVCDRDANGATQGCCQGPVVRLSVPTSHDLKVLSGPLVMAACPLSSLDLQAVRPCEQIA